MRQELSSLAPKRVWELFDELLNIPHKSGSEELVINWLVKFAQTHQFTVKQEPVGNVIMDIPASAGKSKVPLCILQAHMDMVAVRAPDSTHDFSRDPIEIVCQNGYIAAKGTTLGADNGIGICTILALLEDESLSHGPLRAIFTVEEETTMKGACGLADEDLQAQYLINLDSEDTDQMCVSCAGSCDVELTFKAHRIVPEECIGLTLKLSGLPGGHSGADIHQGLPNAIIILSVMLHRLKEDFDFFIVAAQGGTARNAIPAECSYILSVPKAQYTDFTAALEHTAAQLKQELRINTLSLDIQPTAVTDALPYAESIELLDLICALPDGVMGMSRVDPQVVETSSNLGLISSSAGAFTLVLMPRSLEPTGITAVCEKIEAICGLTDNCELTISNSHPCWPAVEHGYLRNIVLDQFTKVTQGRKMHVTAMHAGIECAQFSEKNPNLEQISIGATIRNPHSVFERVEISGVEEIYQTVHRTLGVL